MKFQERTAELSEYTETTIKLITDKQKNDPSCPASLIHVPFSMNALLRNLDQFIVEQLSNDTTEERLGVIQYNVYKEGH